MVGQEVQLFCEMSTTTFDVPFHENGVLKGTVIQPVPVGLIDARLTTVVKPVLMNGAFREVTAVGAILML